MLRLITNFKVKKIMEDYKKEKLKVIGRYKFVNPPRAVVKKPNPCKTFYDSSDLCLKSLIHKIEDMIKVNKSMNVLDALNEDSNYNSRVIFTEGKKRSEKK